MCCPSDKFELITLHEMRKEKNNNITIEINESHLKRAGKNNEKIPRNLNQFVLITCNQLGLINKIVHQRNNIFPFIACVHRLYCSCHSFSRPGYNENMIFHTSSNQAGLLVMHCRIPLFQHNLQSHFLWGGGNDQKHLPLECIEIFSFIFEWQ